MAKKKATKTAQEVDLLKDEFSSILRDYWKMLATSIFKWSGFASEYIGEYIERVLYEYGSIVFFIDDVDGVQKALKWNLQGSLNIYGEPKAWNVIGVNGFNKYLTEDNSVRIFNNKLKIPTYRYVYYYIGKLVNIDGAIDVNVNAIKTPYIFAGDESQLLTMKNTFQKISDNEPVIYKNSKSMLDNVLEVHDLKVDYRGKDLSELFDYYEGKILTYLGLKSVKSDKKERLVVDEANQNEDFKNINFASMLDARQKAVKEINKMFDLNITVELNPMLVEKKEEGKENGKLHNDDSGNN